MPYVTFGQEIQQLFSLHKDGRISSDDFEQRKRYLLNRSKCRLSVPVTRASRGNLASWIAGWLRMFAFWLGYPMRLRFSFTD